MTDCVFCDIIAGRAAVSLIHEDEHCFALMTIGPVNKGHAMVIPRAHWTYVADVEPAVLGHIMQVGARVGDGVRRSGLPCEAINYFIADGEAAGQEVFHMHLHVYPRVKDDGFGFRYDERHFSYPPRAALDAAARRIADAMT